MGENNLSLKSKSNPPLSCPSPQDRPPETHFRKPNNVIIDNEGFQLVQTRSQKRNQPRFGQTQSQISSNQRRKEDQKINSFRDRTKQTQSEKPPAKFSLNGELGQRSWADIVSEQSNEPKDEDCSLETILPIQINSKKYGVVKETVCKRAMECWNNSVLVYIVSSKPYFVFFKEYIKRVWKPKGEFEIFSRENGFFLIKFCDSQDFNSIIQNGSYFYNGKLIIMRRWTKSLKMDRDLLSTMPVWIRLPSVNLKLWNREAFSIMASIIRKPIKMDAATTMKTRLNYARILVEVSAMN